jgi:hypothetical protein
MADAIITIEKKGRNLHVNYQKEVNGKLLEIEGSLIEQHDGRADFYEFEPSWFSNEECKDFFDENWESVEQEIVNQI